MHVVPAPLTMEGYSTSESLRSYSRVPGPLVQKTTALVFSLLRDYHLPPKAMPRPSIRIVCPRPFIQIGSPGPFIWVSRSTFWLGSRGPCVRDRAFKLSQGLICVVSWRQKSHPRTQQTNFFSKTALPSNTTPTFQTPSLRTQGPGVFLGEDSSPSHFLHPTCIFHPSPLCLYSGIMVIFFHILPSNSRLSCPTTTTITSFHSMRAKRSSYSQFLFRTVTVMSTR